MLSCLTKDLISISSILMGEKESHHHNPELLRAVDPIARKTDILGSD